MKRIAFLALIIIFCFIFISGCSNSNPSATTAAPSTSSSGSSASVSDGKTLLDTRCTSCHTLSRIVNVGGTADQWQQVVDQMIQRGAVLSPAEETVLVKYLADNFK